MEIAGWVLWAIVLFFAGGGAFFLVRGLKTGITAQTIASIVCQWILVLWSAVAPDFNKLHLIWLFPLTYLMNLPSVFLISMGKFPGKWATLLVSVAIYSIVLAFLSS